MLLLFQYSEGLGDGVEVGEEGGVIRLELIDGIVFYEVVDTVRRVIHLKLHHLASYILPCHSSSNVGCYSFP